VRTKVPQKAWWGVAFLFVTLAALAWLLSREPGTGQRTYRIGWQTSPPYRLAGSGEPTGLAVDLVREAARRRGIKLRWVQWMDSSESALRNQRVDLWPLITITPERLKIFHITGGTRPVPQIGMPPR
jgi:ABC-type amino acid transport substrate-binding protein